MVANQAMPISPETKTPSKAASKGAQDAKETLENMREEIDGLSKNVSEILKHLKSTPTILKVEEVRKTTVVGMKISFRTGVNGNVIWVIDSMTITPKDQEYVDAIEKMSASDKKLLSSTQEGYLKTLTNNKLKVKGNGYNNAEWKQHLTRYITSINPRLHCCLEALLVQIDSSKLSSSDEFPEIQYTEDITQMMKIQVTQAIQSSVCQELSYLMTDVAQTDCLRALHNVMSVCNPNTAVRRMNDLSKFIAPEKEPNFTHTGQYAAQLKMSAKEINSRNGSTLISDELLCAKLLSTVKALPNYKDVYEATVASIEGSDALELNFTQISNRLAALSTNNIPTNNSANMAKSRGGKGGKGGSDRKNFVTGKVLKEPRRGEKKQPCFNFLNGRDCPFGDECHFSHKFKLQPIEGSDSDEEETNSHRRPNINSRSTGGFTRGRARGGRNRHAAESGRGQQKKSKKSKEGAEKSDGSSSSSSKSHGHKSNITRHQKSYHRKQSKGSSNSNDSFSTGDESDGPQGHYSGAALRYNHRSHFVMKDVSNSILTIFVSLIFLFLTSVGKFCSQIMTQTFHTCSSVFKSIGKPKKMILLDSGCTFCMSGDINIFVAETLKDVNEPVTIADKSKVMATKKGLAIIGGAVMECLFVEGFETLVSKSWLVSQRFSSITTTGGAETFYDHQGKPYLTFQLHPTYKLFLLSELAVNDEKYQHKCNNSD